MTDAETKSLQAKEKQELKTPAEQMTPGPAFTPAVDIFETERQITVLADLPGAKSKDLNIDLDNNVLTISADVKEEKNPDETVLLNEYRTGRYFRQFTLSEVIDQGKIDAGLKDGVLRLTLPKVEAAKPRKISVKAG